MRRVAFACLFIAAALVSALRPTPADRITAAYSFEQYVKEYAKPYKRGTIEYGMRHANFKMALARVLEHNANPRKTYVKGINRFSDWMEEELRGIRGARFTPEFRSSKEVPFVPNKSAAIAPEVDYRKAFPAVLTAVKDQGNCGDCWAHATTEAIESAYAIKTGQLFVLSQQQMTSCTPAHYTCYSCNGSYPRLAYDFVAQGGPNAQYGLVEEWRYPFESWMGDFPPCRTNRTVPLAYGFQTNVQLIGYTQIAPNSQEDIMAALNTLGPLSILVDANPWSDYAGGVFTGCSFGPNFGLDHAVLLVGYGHDSVSDLDYWIVRNSWSAGWGENGYIRIVRTSNMTCGITGGLSCQSNYTANITSCGPCGMFTDAQFPLVNVTAYEQP